MPAAGLGQPAGSLTRAYRGMIQVGLAYSGDTRPRSACPAGSDPRGGGRADAGVRSSSTYTVRQAVDDWLREGLDGTSERTRTLYEGLLGPLIEVIGARPLRLLSAGDVRTGLGKLADRYSTRRTRSRHPPASHRAGPAAWPRFLRAYSGAGTDAQAPSAKTQAAFRDMLPCRPSSSAGSVRCLVVLRAWPGPRAGPRGGDPVRGRSGRSLGALPHARSAVKR